MLVRFQSIFELFWHVQLILTRHFAVMPNGLIASGSDDTHVIFWNNITGSITYDLAGHTVGVSALASFQSGYLASGSWDKTVKIWNSN